MQDLQDSWLQQCRRHATAPTTGRGLVHRRCLLCAVHAMSIERRWGVSQRAVLSLLLLALHAQCIR